jgi:hypothetical protein
MLSREHINADMFAPDEIRTHIERHIGPIQQVFNQWDDESSPISVQHVGPSDVRPVHTLVTLGMSARAMSVPASKDAPRYLELMVTLPEQWKLDAEAYNSEEWYWPVRLLHSLAHRPHDTGGWIGWGDTIPNGEPPRPYAKTTLLCGALIVPSLLVPTQFYELKGAQHNVAFFSVVPLYREEMELANQNGTQALIERIVDRDVNDVIDPKRKNVARKRFGLF